MIKSFVITLVTVVNSSEIVKKVKFYSLTGLGGNLQGVIKLRGEELDAILLNPEKEIKNKTKFYLPINLFTSQQGVLNFLLFGVQRAAVMKKLIEQKRKCSPLEDVKLFYVL